jgi:hypothetical protein
MVFEKFMKSLNNIFGWGGLVGVLFILAAVWKLDHLPTVPAVTNTTNTAKVSGSAVTNTDVDFAKIADRADNGTDGGFTLLRVTTRQWDFLKERGLKLHFFGNVGDYRYPHGTGPILVNSGFFDGATREWLPENARPEVFWVALQTSPSVYAAKEASSGMAVLPFMTIPQAIRLGMTNDDEFVAVPAMIITQDVETNVPLQILDGYRRKKKDKEIP